MFSTGARKAARCSPAPPPCWPTIRVSTCASMRRASRCAWCSIGAGRCARRRAFSRRPATCWCLPRPTATRKAGPGDERLGDARVERMRVKRSHLDLAAVFARLAELEVNDVLVEAGPRLSGALLAAGLVDEWLLYVAPKLLGKDAKPVALVARLTRARGGAGVRAARFEGRGSGPAPAVAAEARGQEIDVHGDHPGDRRNPAHRSARRSGRRLKIAASKCRSRPSRASG